MSVGIPYSFLNATQLRVSKIFMDQQLADLAWVLPFCGT
jgi:hypothetical protein